MGTIEVTFKHQVDGFDKACGIEEYTKFISSILENTLYQLNNDENYNYSDAMEDIILQTRKHLGLGNTPGCIWTDDVITVVIAFKLGKILGELKQ